MANGRRGLGIVLAKRGNYEDALTSLDESKSMRQGIGTLVTPAGSKLLLSIGVVPLLVLTFISPAFVTRTA